MGGMFTFQTSPELGLAGPSADLPGGGGEGSGTVPADGASPTGLATEERPFLPSSVTSWGPEGGVPTGTAFCFCPGTRRLPE